MEFWPNCKYAKHPSPIFQSSTLAAAAQMYKLFASREFPRSLGLFRTIVHSHVRKRTPEWNGRNQNTCWSRQLSHRNVYGVFTSSASRLLSQPTRVKIPRSTVPFQAANFWQSGRWSQIPLSERERGLFCLKPLLSPVNRVPQLVCKSPQLKNHYLGRRKRHTGVYSFQFRYLVKAHDVQRSAGRRFRHPDTAIVVL